MNPTDTENHLLYRNRNPRDLGAWYLNHLNSMTSENLVEKAEIATELAARDKDLFDFRFLLARVYNPTGLYLNDGEIQDNSMIPYIDFRRDTVETIKEKIERRQDIQNDCDYREAALQK